MKTAPLYSRSTLAPSPRPTVLVAFLHRFRAYDSLIYRLRNSFSTALPLLANEALLRFLVVLNRLAAFRIFLIGVFFGCMKMSSLPKTWSEDKLLILVTMPDTIRVS